MKNNKSLTIGWLYPDLMSTYGDRGNIVVLSKLLQWNGIIAEVLPIQQHTSLDQIKTVDFIFGGGSQDSQQEIVMRDLMGKKGEVIKELIEQNKPALFVCGSPQIMGNYYEPAFGKKIEGLGIFDMVSINPGSSKPRCIGNIIAEINWDNVDSLYSDQNSKIVGFENHGGRTYLGKNCKPFAKVLHGYGNNGEDHTEGVVYKHAVGCYFHGPLLPKNPQVAKYLLEKALSEKYNENTTISLEQNDVLSEKAKNIVISRFIAK
jgi:CobQ-like glutamine amidotransferase family enzyme